MTEFDFPQAEEYKKKNRRKQFGLRALTAASAVVVFITVYMLILPAITMETELVCAKEEHEHTEECYEFSGEEKILICEKEEHIHTEECFAQTPDEESEMFSDPIALEGQYIEGAELYYRPKNSTDDNAWIKITPELTDVPGDASVKLVVDYKDVSIDSLLAASGKMTYVLPNLLKDPAAKGVITSGNKNVGTIETSGNTAVLVFDQSWLEQQKEGGSDVVSGDFYVEARFDLSQVPEEGPGHLVVGDVTIDINFEDDIHASSADVNIEKTVSNVVTEDASGAEYLEYTLTVSVPGGSAAVPDVKVTDSITEGAKWAEAYIWSDADVPAGTELSVSDKTETSAGKLEWRIGTMSPGQSLSLTYRVKLKDGYTGSHKPADAVITNAAEVYSKTHKRDDAVAHFNPEAGMTMSKTSSKYQPNEKGGGGKLIYTIWVKAYETNSWTLDNVKIKDSFSNNSNLTSPEFRKYLHFEEESFKLYKGSNDQQNGVAGLEEIAGAENFHPQGEKNPVLDSTTDSFEYYVGSMEPGECKTLTYTVDIEEGIFAVGNDNVYLHNRAFVWSDDTRPGGGSQYSAYNCNYNIGRKCWDRKLSGKELQEKMTVLIPENDKVFEQPGTEESSPPSEFTVPAGSYRYQVVVNEAGDWDVSSATLRDELGDYLAFSGYVKVEAFEISSPPSTGQTDESAVAGLEGKTPVSTAWLKINNQKNFGFQPEDLGMKGEYAYLLTYYAKPDNLGENISVVVGNDFYISGTVVGEGNLIILDGIHVSTNVTVHGSDRYGAEKQSWYYEPPKDGATADWSKGELYWVLKISGSKIPKGIQLKDIPAGNHEIKETSVAAAYQGTLPKNIQEYKSVEELQEAGLKPLTKIAHQGDRDPLPEDAEFTWGKYTLPNGQTTAVITFRKEIPLDEEEEEAVYIIIKTAPKMIPTGKRETMTYENRLQSSGDSGNTWSDENSAKQTLYGSGGCFKESAGAYTYDGKSEWTVLDKGEGGKYGYPDRIVKTDAKAGTYVEWRMHVNYDGGMSGLVQITDNLPKGMEPVYVRSFWIGADYGKNPPALPIPSTPEIEELEGDVQWKRMELTYAGDGDRSGLSLTCVSYYNAGTGQIRWNVKDIAPGGADKDRRAVEFQVLCRLKDDALLQGGTADYVNQFEAVDSLGKKEDDTAQVTITKDTLAKKGTYDPETNGGIYPFEIKINPLGEDLVSGAEKITLVDELSKTLILDTTSIEVLDTRTETAVSGCTFSVDQTDAGQILKLTVPDDLPLTIRYQAAIDAAPGQEIAISNKAHWEGYTSPEGGNVSDDEFSYKAGGTAGANAKAGFSLVKADQANVQAYLAGAEFFLEEVELNQDGEFCEVSANGGKVSDIKTTNEKGEAQFSLSGDDRWMKFNTIYRLTETKAPEGFVLDRTPYYFAIAKKVEINGVEDYPAELLKWSDKGVRIDYGGAHYTYLAYNHKGEAAVEKIFLKYDGTPFAGENEPDGSYRFGLYENVQNGQEAAVPLQTMTMICQNGVRTYKRGDITVKQPNFINLDLGKTYYIYEIDDRGFPIIDGAAASSDGKSFIVTYENGKNDITASKDDQVNGNIPKVTVTNREKVFELPQTGGRGTRKLYILGGALAMAAAVILFYKKKKEGN